MVSKALVRINTAMCVGRICIGYRGGTVGASGPDYVAVISVFISVFVIVWAALVILLVVCLNDDIHAIQLTASRA